MTSLEGQVALVTGASRGLGHYVALRLAQAGMRVALCARSEPELEAVAREITDGGGEALVCPLDVRDHAQVVACVERVLDRFGQLDVLINNAGLGWYKPLEEWSPEEIDLTLDVNLKGLIYLCRAVLPHMLGRGQGQIVNVASDVGRRPIAKMATYVASKYGVVGFSASLLREVKDRGVKVMTLLPGVIDTYFGGAVEGTRDEPGAMRSEAVAEVIYAMLTQPTYVVLDEVMLHPTRQDY